MSEMENVLVARMFGGFSLTWNGKVLTGSAKSGESQFSQLMQYLLHHRATGVSRQHLVQTIFAERDVDNVYHAIRSVIYNAKKRLRLAGLPDVNYIEQRRDLCFWTEEVPVFEDASEMDRLYQLAEQERDLDERLGLYLDACRLYTGEFLPSQAAVTWVAQEARHYRGVFCDCVEKAVQLLRMNQDFHQMEELGLYATSVQPLSDWEAVTMEALVSQRRYEEAKRFYDDTVELYFQEQGLRPSKRLMELLHKLGSKLEYQYAVLDDIQAKLSENRAGVGGYFCSYPVFQGIYQMVERMMERGGQSVFLMLCTVVDSKGNPMREGSKLDELSHRLADAISHSVRHSDAVNRYGKGQYLILLVNTTLENCELVKKRINYHFLVGRQRTGIQYYINSVICAPDREPAGTGCEERE